MEEEDKIVIAVEGKIQLVPESEIKSNSITQEMAAKRTALPVYSSTMINKQLRPKYLELPRKGEYNKEREESNEQAFQAWLRKKSETELHRRSATPMESQAESCEEKRRLNQAAFTAWLEKKNARAAAEATSAAVATSQSPTMKTIKYNRSFEEWKKKKDVDQIRHSEIESYQKKEMNERMKRVDPEVANKAYKRWLLQKRNQAIEAAVAKDRHRKLFMLESRNLSRSLK